MSGELLLYKENTVKSEKMLYYKKSLHA